MTSSKQIESKYKQALSSEIDLVEIKSLQQRIDKNGELINQITNKLVKDYCEPLDKYMSFIMQILNNEDNPPTDIELDDFTLKLPVLLYFTGEAQETLGIKEDIAKAVRQEIYNQEFDKSTGTIADKTAKAELLSQSEQITHIAYQRAYKKIKLRMEAGYETLQSIKKVITRRSQEYELAKIEPSRIGAN